jgi:CheY-like chemotaxis protein
MDELPIILVVEDEASIRDFVEDALTDGGFHLMVSPSVEEALTWLKSGAVRYRVCDRHQSQRQNERLGACKTGQRDRAILPHYLHDRRCRRSMGIIMRSQQHPFAKAVRSGAADHGHFATSQHRKRANRSRLAGRKFQ